MGDHGQEAIASARHLTPKILVGSDPTIPPRLLL